MNTLIVLVIILIILSGWNLKSLWDLKKFNRSKLELKDDRYYELKYKNEFITTVAIVVIGVGGFFGYKMSDEINKRADSLKTRLDSLDRLIISKKDTLTNYEEIQDRIDKRVKISADSLTVLSRRINVINNKSVIKQDFYIVDNLEFPIAIKAEPFRFYYNKLTTIGGDPLPTFKKAPFLVAVPENASTLTIVYIGREYFEIDCGMTLGPTNPDTAKFSILISQK
jgi:hypothetical protein